MERVAPVRRRNADASSNRRDAAAENLRHHFSGFLPGGDERAAGGNLPEQGRDVRRGYHLQECVGGIVPHSPDFTGGIVEGKALSFAERADGSFVEGFLLRKAEMILVFEENQSHDAPEVIDPIGVVERHAPAVLLRRKTPQEQDPGPNRQKRFERMLLGIHLPKVRIAREPCNYIGADPICFSIFASSQRLQRRLFPHQNLATIFVFDKSGLYYET